MSWMLMVGLAWPLIAIGVASLIGRSVRLADRSAAALVRPVVPDFVPAEWSAPATGPR
jgi:hypothetical protein